MLAVVISEWQDLGFNFLFILSSFYFLNFPNCFLILNNNVEILFLITHVKRLQPAEGNSSQILAQVRRGQYIAGGRVVKPRSPVVMRESSLLYLYRTLEHPKQRLLNFPPGKGIPRSVTQLLSLERERGKKDRSLSSKTSCWE